MTLRPGLFDRSFRGSYLRSRDITPYKETELHGPNFTRPPPDLIDGEPEYEVEKILDAQQRGRGHKTHFLVKWKGYPTSDNSWEPRENLHADELIADFYKRSPKPNQTKPKQESYKKGTESAKRPQPTFLHNHPFHSYIMSSPSAPIETTPRHSPIPSATPSIVSVPDNTPERPLTPQLARHTEPFDEEVASTFGRLSTIDYNQPEEEEDPYRAPPGFIPNSRDGRLFYPVYVKDSNYDATTGGSHTMLAPYIQYSSDYTKVTGTEGVGFERRTIPVYIGKRACHFQKMTTEKWRYFVTNCDAWTVFSFSLPLFIACTITVGHVTDDLYFRT
jgi:hypothetical protein